MLLERTLRPTCRATPPEDQQAIQSHPPMAMSLLVRHRADYDHLSTASMARTMEPMTSVAIRDLRTEGQGGLATVWFEASWISGSSAEDGTTVEVRGMMLWRKESDGTWRVAIEHLS